MSRTPRPMPAKNALVLETQALPEGLESLLDSLPVAMLVLRTDGRVLHTNRWFGEQFGARERETGAHLAAYLGRPAEIGKLLSALERDGHLENYKLVLRRADGRPVCVQISAQPVAPMGELGYIFSLVEIAAPQPARSRPVRRAANAESLSRQAERLHALNEIEQAMISSLDLKTILELLVWQSAEQLHVDATAVLLYNTQTQTLDFAAKQGFYTDALEFTSLKIGSGLAGQAAKERKLVYLDNLAEIDKNSTLAKAILDEKFVTYIGIPLISKERLLGVMEIFHRSKLAPDLDWLTFLETLADQAAIAINNAHLLEATQQSLKETNALYRINQDLIASTDPEALMQNVVDLLQKSFGYYYVQIFVADLVSGHFVVRAGSGPIGKKLKKQRYHLAPGDGIVGLTAETGKPFFTNNVDEVISFVRTPFLAETKSELAVPIKAGTQFLGLLDIHQVAPAYLTDRDVQLVCGVADQLAVALQKASLYADLQESLRQEQATRSQLIHSEKLAVTGRLLASVSHELNNPIQAIQNALFLLKEEKGISSQGKQDLEIVLAETDRMAAMLERLRATYQPVNSDNFRSVQINDVIEDVCALVATHLRHNRISFEFLSDPDLPLVIGVIGQLRQVILNLFMNAVDAMSEGGHLSIATRYIAESREVLLTVSDTGPGISPAIMPNIFEAFVTNKERGSGLGLAISYEIILKHRGRIQAQNNPGRGATFSIWLPASQRGEK